MRGQIFISVFLLFLFSGTETFSFPYEYIGNITNPVVPKTKPSFLDRKLPLDKTFSPSRSNIAADRMKQTLQLKKTKRKYSPSKNGNGVLNSALKAKDYEKAGLYLDELLKKNPNDLILLKLRANVSAMQNDFNKAVLFMEKVKELAQKNEPQSNAVNLENDKIRAFFYSRANNPKLALEIIETNLESYPNDEELLTFAIEYSMLQQKWEKALIYTNRALLLKPDSEHLLSVQGDLYSFNQDYEKAIEIYQRLVKVYGKDEYKLVLADLYRANENFAEAESIIVPMYGESPIDNEVLTVFTNILLAQEKSAEAYDLIKEHGLEGTLEGLRVQADAAMLEEDYEKANKLYKGALELDRENEYIKGKLAKTLLKSKKFEEAGNVYSEMLKKNPKSEYARMGLAELDMEKKDYKKARTGFQKILEDDPENNEAKMGMVYSYLGDNQNFKALNLLDEMPSTDEVRYVKASIYYNLSMYSNAKDELKGLVQKSAKDLAYQIKRSRAFMVTPTYTFFDQELSETYDLDLRKVGINLCEYGAKNTKVSLDYGMYVYISGNYNDRHLANVTNEIKGSLQGRPTEKTEYKADIGIKASQFGGAMVNTDSWIKHHVDDSFSYKVGFKRNNVEQSYLAAVGFPINGVFTGRVAENKAYVEFDKRLKNKCYIFGRGAGGVYTAQNLQTNPFSEGMIGVGKVIYNKPENKWFQLITTDLVCYNSSYQYDMLHIPGETGSQSTFGGYFSPSFYNADTVSLKLEGENKKWHLKYGIKGFVGAQFIFSPDNITPVYGVYPFLSYDLNDHVSVNLSYSFSDYSGIQRHLAIISVNIRGFGK